MKALKGVLTYIGIVLLAITLIGATVIGIMFFGKVNLFGYYFVQDSTADVLIADIKGLNSDSIVNLSVVAKNYNVVIEPSLSLNDSVQVIFSNDYYGFLKGVTSGEKTNKVIQPSVTIENETVDNTTISTDTVSKNEITKKVVTLNDTNSVKVTINEPEGLLKLKKGCIIKVCVPFSKAYNLNIATNNGNITVSNGVDETKSDTNGKNILPINVNGLKLSTLKGSANLSNFGSVKGQTLKDVSFDSLDITTAGGKFDFSDFDTVTVKNDVVLSSSDATYVFKTLIVGGEITNNSTTSGNIETNTTIYNNNDGGVEITGKMVKFTADKVYTGKKGFNYRANTGLIDIKELYAGEVTTTKTTTHNGTGTNKKVTNITTEHAVKPYEISIFTSSANVNLTSVIGKLGLTNEYGAVNIGTLSNQASIKNEHGNINIDVSGKYPFDNTSEDKVDNKTSFTANFSETSSLIIYNTYGDIVVGEYYQDGIFQNRKGKTDVYSKYNTEKSTRYYYTDILSKSGKVTATTDKNPIRITATDHATINLTINGLLDILPQSNDSAPDWMKTSKTGMYVANTTGGTVNVTVPVASYYLIADGKVSGPASNPALKYGKEPIQMNNYKDNQSTIELVAKKIVLNTPY